METGRLSGRLSLSSAVALDFHDDRHDHGAAAGDFLDVAFEFDADLFLDDAVVGDFFAAEGVDGAGDEVACGFGDVSAAEAAEDDFGLAFDLAGALVDGDDGEDDAIFREGAAVLDDEVFDDVNGGAGVNEDAACGDLAVFAGLGLVEFEDVAVFHDDCGADSAGFDGDLGVLLEVAEVAVDGDEVLGADEVDEEALLFLRAVAGDVDESLVAVVVDDVGFAAAEVIDDAEDGFLVAGDDAGAEQDGVAWINVRVLVGIDGGAAEGGHGFALGAGDEYEELVGGDVAHLAGVDDEPGGDVEIAEVLRDLSAFVHAAAENGDLAAVCAGQFHGDADAVDGGRKATEEEALFGVGEDFVEARFDAPLGGSVAVPFDVGGVLQKSEDAALAVLGEGVQIEGLAVWRGEVDFEVAGVDDDADGGLNGEGDAIDEGVG